MPEDDNATTGNQAEETPEKPKVRRISNKAPRKTEDKSSEEDTPPEATDADSPGKSAESAKPEQKRSNRRRRGKGKSSGQVADKDREPEASETEETLPSAKAEPDSGKKETKPAPREQSQSGQRPTQKPRPKLDPDKVAKNAWKIYLAEVSEEGVALIGDNDARELARRCFRLSEIFLEEEDRRS